MNENVPTLRLAVLLSGTGRTLENLFAHRRRGELDAEVVAVASNRDAVRGLEIAEREGVPHRSFRLSRFADAAARDAAMADWVRGFDPDLVLLAGYLALLDVGAFRELPVLNIHPALLPRFGGQGYYGNRVHAAVLEAGESVSGCTVHRVDAEYDRGRILDREEVEVRPDDTVDTLAARVFEAECVLYPRTINAIARGELDPR